MNKDDLSAHIRSAGFRATKPRVLVLTHLQKVTRPQSILEIADALKHTIDQVTVYRIIGTFAKAGLVRELHLRRGRPLYEAVDPHDHHHVVCTNCDRIAHFSGCDSERLASRALKQAKGFEKITSHSLEFFGLCNSCATKGRALQAA